MTRRAVGPLRILSALAVVFWCDATAFLIEQPVGVLPALREADVLAALILGPGIGLLFLLRRPLSPLLAVIGAAFSIASLVTVSEFLLIINKWSADTVAAVVLAETAVLALTGLLPRRRHLRAGI